MPPESHVFPRTDHRRTPASPGRPELVLVQSGVEMVKPVGDPWRSMFRTTWFVFANPGNRSVKSRCADLGGASTPIAIPVALDIRKRRQQHRVEQTKNRRRGPTFPQASASKRHRRESRALPANEGRSGMSRNSSLIDVTPSPLILPLPEESYLFFLAPPIRGESITGLELPPGWPVACRSDMDVRRAGNLPFPPSNECPCDMIGAH